MPTQAQLDAFTRKWNLKFADNEFQNIRESTFREFSTDIVATFGVTVANVPAYQPGTPYQKGTLVRYTPAGGQEAFYYSLKAGVLGAPGPANPMDWKVVPGPTTATALSQEITLLQAQGIENDQVVAGRTYLIDFGPDANGVTQTIAVRGVSNNCFDTTGTLEVNGVRTAVTEVNVGAGTWKVQGTVDAYTKAQADALLATKQGAVTEQVLLPIYGAANNLSRSYFGKSIRLVTTQDSVLNLPTPTLDDLGKVLVLHHYAGAGAQAALTIQATLATDTTATYYTKVPRDYVVFLEIVKITRGTPNNDTVASYAVLANSRVEPGNGYTDAQARAAQLGRVAAAGTTTVTLTEQSPVDYGTAASGTITVDPAGAVPGKGARFGLSGGANPPNFLTPAGALPYQVVGSYVAGKKFNYSLYVCSDVIQVVITQL
ncbi:MAG: hypothetical protein ACRYFZ_03475 [Janthinobacterium lividum]